MSRDETVVATEATETASVTEPTETAATPTDEAAKAEATAPAGPTKEDIESALADFEELVDGILGQPAGEGQDAIPGRIDAANGSVSAEDMALVVEAFRNLPGGTRAHTKAMERLQLNQMTALTEHMWAVGARAIALILIELRAAGKTTKPKAETVAKPTVSPTEAHVTLGAAHVLAVNFLPVGEGVDENWGQMINDKVNSLRDEVMPLQQYLAAKAAWDALTDEEKANQAEPVQPEVDPIVLQAARIARGRVAGPKKAAREPKVPGTSVPRDPGAPRGDILAHIKEVFESLPVGTFLKVGAIAKVGTSQYGAGQASGGAISARIKGEAFGKVEGLEYVNDGNGQGVRKTA